MAATLFGKPRSEVIKHPGSFSAAAHKAGESTHEFAHQKHTGKMAKKAALAKAFETMRAKKGK